MELQHHDVAVGGSRSFREVISLYQLLLSVWLGTRTVNLTSYILRHLPPTIIS